MTSKRRTDPLDCASVKLGDTYGVVVDGQTIMYRKVRRSRLAIFIHGLLDPASNRDFNAVKLSDEEQQEWQDIFYEEACERYDRQQGVDYADTYRTYQSFRSYP